MDKAVMHVSCPNCREDDTRFWAKENGFTAVKCKPCGLVYVNPRPSDSMITDSHKLGQHDTEEGTLNVKARRVSSKVAKYQKIVSEFFRGEISAKTPMTWLDVGAGYGEVVEAATLALPEGSRVSGIEPMAAKVAAAESGGVSVSNRKLEDVTETFDVISLINVYSHIPDFDAFGAALVARLNANGVLFLETGNLGDLESGSDFPNILVLPDHLVFAGVSQMIQTLERLGLTVERHETRAVGGLMWTFKTFVKGVLRGRINVVLPNRAPFKTVFYKARKTPETARAVA